MTRGSLRWALVLIWASACGASPPPEPEVAESPDAPEPSEPAESASDTPAETGEAEAEPPPEAESGASATLGPDDLEDVIRQVLEDPGLDGYLHLDQPGRLPIKLSGPGLPAKLPIIKGGYEVKVVDGPANPKDPVLVFTKIEKDGESVRLRYRYDIEGLSGSAVVFRKDGAWRLGANRVIEK
jgi:hypothetical protein